MNLTKRWRVRQETKRNSLLNDKDWVLLQLEIQECESPYLVHHFAVKLKISGERLTGCFLKSIHLTGIGSEGIMGFRVPTHDLALASVRETLLSMKSDSTKN